MHRLPFLPLYRILETEAAASKMLMLVTTVQLRLEYQRELMEIAM